jgi:Flp pilus assembly protein TadB
VSTERQSVELVLLEQQRDAQAMANRGLVAVALVPISIVGGIMSAMWLDSFMPIVIAALYATLGGCLGLLWLIAGFVRSRNAKRELRELDESRLPKARLLR